MLKPWRWLLPPLLLALALPSSAIVIRHDRPDQRYQALESDFPQVFYLHTRYGKKVCMATLIAPHWALTAAHCTDETPIGATLAEGGAYALEVAGRPNQVTALVVHPQYSAGKLLQGTDLALLYLQTAVADVRPATLNQAADEAGQIVDLIGWGYSGVGTRGRLGNDGRFRRAQNRVKVASQWLEFRFDDPREPDSVALDLEGIPGLGDSGGPALRRGEDGWQLLGIAVGELAPLDSAAAQGLYGAVEIYERVSLHLDWIHTTIGQGRTLTKVAAP